MRWVHERKEKTMSLSSKDLKVYPSEVTQETLTKNQRRSQTDKLADANALVFSAIDDLNLDENSNDIDISNIVESLDTASLILKEVQKFLASKQ